jgi:prepilin-type N-terminal cleavage/methylation domain-containing protein
MKLRRSASAFTLLEIMIVVTLIGVLAAVAIPAYNQSVAKTQMRACITNLKSIDMTKAQWLADARKGIEDTPADAELFGDDKYLRDKPKCPSGGTYDLKTVREKPTCTIPGHSF